MAWRCLCCSKASPEDVPYGAVIFSSSGNFGSTVYDRIANNSQPDKVQGFVCDECFCAKVKDKILICLKKEPVKAPKFHNVVWDPLED